jgi:hypothetical protein
LGAEARSAKAAGGPSDATVAIIGCAVKPLSLDTSPEIERLQIEGWRQMSTEEKAAIVSGLTKAVYELASAGIRQRHPEAAPREQFLRLAIITLGPDLARRAYPEIATRNLE